MRKASIVVTALLSALPAYGQSAQTPASAKTFLQTVMPGSRTVLDPIEYMGNTYRSNNATDTDGYWQTMAEAVAEPDPCKIKFRVPATNLIIGGRKAWSAEYKRHLNFDSINEVRQEGRLLKIVDPKNRGIVVQFFIQSPEMAARVAFAMNFLKSHCNKTDDTGF